MNFAKFGAFNEI